MSATDDNDHPNTRITLPPIRALFKDEFMRPPNAHDSPSMTLARLRVHDDHNTGSPSMGSHPPSPRNRRTRLHRSTSEYFYPELPPSGYDRGSWPNRTPPYPDTHRQSRPPSSTPQSHLAFRAQQADRLPSNGSSDPSPFHPHPRHSYHPQSSDREQDRTQSIPSNHRRYPIHLSSSFPDLRVPIYSSNLVQMPRLPAPPNLTISAQAHGLDSPPALVRAVAPWVIATNMDMGQVYDDEERTPVARPFGAGTLARSTSYPTPLGRFLDEGMQPPLGKYDCKFCGKLFNRPSSLRIHLNSHTGEKPFVCPKEGCGRSFSVLSNMRRHARVHTQDTKEQEGSSDEASRKSSPAATVLSTSDTSKASRRTAPRKASPRSGMHYRRDSNTSASSASSRRSRSVSSDGMEVERPEKRSRHHPK